jgi:osmoprotectant transport system ATP-binding protein
VEDFVGADRALKRLALQRVRDIDLWKAAVVRAGEPVAEVRKKLEDADLDIPLMVDEHGRPQGWVSERGLQGERVRADFRSSSEPVVELDDILRDALSHLLSADTQYGPVVDKSGAVAGVLSIEALSHALSTPADHIPTASELAASSLSESIDGGEDA